MSKIIYISTRPIQRDTQDKDQQVTDIGKGISVVGIGSSPDAKIIKRHKEALSAPPQGESSE